MTIRVASCSQARAAGVPVVATRVDGSPEAVDEGVNGFLVAPGDVGAVAEKILMLLKTPFSKGLPAARISNEFDIHAMVSLQERLYDELLQLTMHA